MSLLQLLLLFAVYLVGFFKHILYITYDLHIGVKNIDGDLSIRCPWI